MLIYINYYNKDSKTNVSNCFMAINMTYEQYLSLNQTITLSKTKDCNSSSICNVKFEQGIDY